MLQLYITIVQTIVVWVQLLLPLRGSISNQATFESTFTIDEVIEDAYERCGVQGITGYQLKQLEDH